MKSKAKHLIAFLVVSIAALCCVPSNADAQYYIQFGNRCFTPFTWCRLPVYAPIGDECYCYNGIYGITYGIVGR